MAAPTAAGKANTVWGDITPEEFHSDTGNGTWARRISYGSTASFTIRASALSTALVTSGTGFSTGTADFVSPPWARGLQIYVDTSVVASGTSGFTTMNLEIQGKDPLSGNYVSLSSGGWMTPSSSSIAGTNGTTGTISFMIYPGITNSTGRQISGAVPGIWKAVTTFAGSSFTITWSAAGQYEP